MIKTKAIKFNYGELCDYAFNVEGKKTGLIGLFDIMWVNEFPSVHQEMSLFAQFYGEPGISYPIELEVVDPNGNKLNPQSGPVKFVITPGPNGKANLVHRMFNFPIVGIGTYSFNLVHNNAILGSVVLTVTKGQESSPLTSN